MHTNQSQHQGSVNKRSPNEASPRSTPFMQSPAIQRVLSLKNADGAPPSYTANDISYLQTSIGNQAVQRLLSGDKPNGKNGGTVTDDMDSRVKRSQGGGSSLPVRVRNILQPKLNADLKDVRVHTGPNAVQLSRDLNAHAFTYKNHIFYGEGKSPNDLQLTAHEAVHTIQQGAVARRKTVDMDGHKEVTDSIQTASTEPTIQRLTTAAQLEGTGGRAKNDWKIGKLKLRRMSTKYKAVLKSLRDYEAILREPIGGDIHGYNFGAPWDVKAGIRLDDVETTINTYLAAHEEDTRSEAILEVKNEIPLERKVLQHIGTHIEDYANMSGEAAIKKADQDILVKKAMDKARENEGGFGEGDTGSELSKVVTGDDEEANTSIEGELQKGRQSWGMNEGQVGQAFRGSDVLSIKAANYAKGNFLPYYLNTVMPAFEEVIRAFRGSGIGETKVMGDDGFETHSNDPTIFARISEVYEKFAGTLMRALPRQLINAAIAVYGRVRKSTANDPEAFSRKIALSTATNTIYVRCFGPALNAMSGVLVDEVTLAERQAITAVVQLLAKQGPGFDLGTSVESDFRRLGTEAAVQRARVEYDRVREQIIAGGEKFASSM